MWHPEILNQQLDGLVSRVIVCQKMVRGFLCRRQLLKMLELVQEQTEDKIMLTSLAHSLGFAAYEKMHSNLRFTVKVCSCFVLKR